MKLKNDFPGEIRQLYLGYWKCFFCDSNGWNRGGLEIHHILGRVSSVAFNSSCLCGECHKHIGHTREEHQTLFHKTLDFLKNVGYNPKKEDYKFLEDNFNELWNKNYI